MNHTPSMQLTPSSPSTWTSPLLALLSQLLIPNNDEEQAPR